jgi:hypothetical protein
MDNVLLVYETIVTNGGTIDILVKPEPMVWSAYTKYHICDDITFDINKLVSDTDDESKES